jgi:hypothetical protein
VGEEQRSMTTTVKGVEHRLAEATKKARREQDAAQAMREYQAERSRVDANTARLRAQRLARESAAIQAVPAAAPKAPRRASKPARARD